VNGREIKTWWLDYGIAGRRFRESAHTTSKRDALALLRQRIGKRTDGTLTGRPDRLTLADLKQGLRDKYALDGNRSWSRAVYAFRHLEAAFGADAKVATLTKARIATYQADRLKAGAARDTVRYETAVLTAAFAAAVKHDRLAMRPVFETVAPGERRTGVLSESDLAALILELPSDVADLVRFLALTGWRRGEGTGLLWAAVDFDDDEYQDQDRDPIPGPNACIRLSAAQTKGKQAREFPFAEAPALRDLLLARWRARDGVRVFHRKGAPIGDFRKRWASACKKAGVEGRLVHDLRRTAARDFRRAGVAESQVMELCGWRTAAMFRRYDITDTTDRQHAVALRFNGKGTANTPVDAAVAI
jgi:integrase